MAGSDELEYLKSLVGQLNEKIKSLEQKALKAVRPTPAEQLRLILIGPPGAGTSRSRVFIGYVAKLIFVYSMPNWTWW